MHNNSNLRRLVSILLFLSASGPVAATEVEVVFTSFRVAKDGGWQVRTTLYHQDSGWDHYADAWRVVGEDGQVYGTRTLFHPHVDEQPFTRMLQGVHVPKDVEVVYLEAHDSVHGWSPRRVKVHMRINVGDQFEVIR